MLRVLSDSCQAPLTECSHHCQCGYRLGLRHVPHCLATDRKNLTALQFGGYLPGQDCHSNNLLARFGLEADWTPSGISARAPRLSQSLYGALVLREGNFSRRVSFS